MLFHYIIRLLGRFLWIRCDYEQPPQPGVYEVLVREYTTNIIARYDGSGWRNGYGISRVHPTHWKYQTRGPKGEFGI